MHREGHLSWNVTFYNLRFITASTMFDVILKMLFLDKLMNIGKITAFVETYVLFAMRALDHDLGYQIIHRPLVILIGAGDMKCQWNPALIHENIDFGAQFSAIRWILPGVFTPPNGTGTILLSVDYHCQTMYNSRA